MNRSERIINAIAEELEKIFVTNGYKTNAGSNINIEEETDDDNELYFVNVSEGDDEVIGEQLDVIKLVNLPIDIELSKKCSLSEHKQVRNDLISDTKKCIETYAFKPSRDISDIEYSGKRKIAREEGAQYSSVIVTFNVEYHERKGDPEH